MTNCREPIEIAFLVALVAVEAAFFETEALIEPLYGREPAYTGVVLGARMTTLNVACLLLVRSTRRLMHPWIAALLLAGIATPVFIGLAHLQGSHVQACADEHLFLYFCTAFLLSMTIQSLSGVGSINEKRSTLRITRWTTRDIVAVTIVLSVARRGLFTRRPSGSIHKHLPRSEMESFPLRCCAPNPDCLWRTSVKRPCVAQEIVAGTLVRGLLRFG